MSGDKFIESLRSKDSQVNPFMRQIFFRISFNTWHSHMLKEEKKKAIRREKRDFGEEITEEELLKILPDEDESVEAILTPDIQEYTTEEEEDD